jgi:hypothetical protein
MQMRSGRMIVEGTNAEGAMTERSEAEAQRRSGEEAPVEAGELEQAQTRRPLMPEISEEEREDRVEEAVERRLVGRFVTQELEYHPFPAWNAGGIPQPSLVNREAHGVHPRSRSAEVEGRHEEVRERHQDSPRTQQMFERLIQQQQDMAQAIFNLQRQSPAVSSPGADSVVTQRVVEALARIQPQVEVPGNPGPYEGGQDFHTWRRYVLRCQTTNRWTARELRDRMGQFLAGPAWTTFERLRDTGALPMDAGYMLDAVGAAHCDIRGAEKAAEAKFLYRRQKTGESIYDFIKVFESLAADCKADDSFKIRTFLTNVQSEAREALTRRDARTWTELRGAAMIEQQVLDSRAASGKGESRAIVGQVSWKDEEEEASAMSMVAAMPGQRSWYQQERRFQGLQGMESGRAQGQVAQQTVTRAGGKTEGNEQPPTAELSIEEKLDRLTELVLAVTQASMPQMGRRCFRCQRPGHIARDCQASGNEGGAGGAAGPRAPPK